MTDIKLNTDGAPKTNIWVLRQKYPQYDDISDEQLLGGIHRKYYSDMPFGKFLRRVGGTASGGLNNQLGSSTEQQTPNAPGAEEIYVTTLPSAEVGSRTATYEELMLKLREWRQL